MTELKVNELKKYSIGYCLKRLRCKNDLTQQKLAKLIGCSQSAISTWESESCVPHGQTLEKIIKLYDLPFDFFDDFDDDKSLNSSFSESEK